MLKVIKSVTDLLVGNSCFACGGSSSTPICDNCYPLISFLENPFCQKCGYPTMLNVQYCRQCSSKAYNFTTGRSLMAYEGLAKKMLIALKKENGYRLVDLLVRKSINDLGLDFSSIEAIAFIPTTMTKKIDRGHNVSEIIARCFSYHLKIPALSLLGVNKNLKDQANLNFTQRQKNLKDAFILKKYDNKIKKVLLVDDIFTTGATLKEASKVLSVSGIETIFFTLARTL